MTAQIPALPAAHVNRGNALAALQEDAMAVLAFQTALSLSPELPSALINMATSLHAMGRLDDAVDALLDDEEDAADAEALWPATFISMGPPRSSSSTACS